MVRLTAEKPGCALGMFKSTFQVESSQRFRYHHSTITRIQRGYQQTGTTRGCPCPGQQRVTTRSQYLTPPYSWWNVARTTPTVQGRWGFIGRPSLLLCWTYPDWSTSKWAPMLGNDESMMIPLRNADGRLQMIDCCQLPGLHQLWVWCRCGEHHYNDCLVKMDRWGGRSVMVCPGMSHHHRTALPVCHGRMNTIYYYVLQNHIIHFYHHRDIHTSQHDTSQAHTAHVTTQYLANNTSLSLN